MLKELNKVQQLTSISVSFVSDRSVLFIFVVVFPTFYETKIPCKAWDRTNVKIKTSAVLLKGVCRA